MKDVFKDLEATEWRTRLKFLSDFVIGTAMTIMILSLELPEMGNITNTGELTKFLLRQLSSMGGFFIAFVTVAIYWMKHLEHFGMIKRVNQTFMWFQLLFMAMIMLVPFWNAYVTNFPDNIAIKVFFSLNLVLIGLFSFLSFNYATSPKNSLVIEGLPEELILLTKRQILTEPAIAIIAAGLVFVHPTLWDITFVLIPVMFALRKKFVQVRSGKSKKAAKN
ncbi:DUF1211 domain-containing protein [bacterium SCSIO 12741]|nr:DUF1211 domain-containing protein [bacterium SCSIO 12741]